MSKVAVVYWSGTGNTEAMANKVAEGAKAAGAEVEVISADDFDGTDISGFDGVAFGCPAMGDEELEDSVFQPVFEACEAKLAGKKVALFGSYGWGDGEWMRSWEEKCQNDGVALAVDSVICNEDPDDEAQAACIELGKAANCFIKNIKYIEEYKIEHKKPPSAYRECLGGRFLVRKNPRKTKNSPSFQRLEDRVRWYQR